MTFSKRLTFIILTIVLILGFSFILGEISLRLYYVFSSHNRPLLIPHPYLGQMRPQQTKFVYVYDEGPQKIKVAHRTNAMSLMGEEIQVKKPKDVYRILILGDSYTESVQTPDGQNFSQFLEDKLNQSQFQGKRVEVINAGIAGYSPLRMYLLYKKKLAKLNSDVVMMQLFANDVYEDNRFTATSIMDEKGLPIRIQHYFIDPNQKQIQNRQDYKDNSLLNWIREFVLRKSRLVEYFYARHYRLLKKSKYNKMMSDKEEYFIGNQFFALYNQNGPLERKEFRDHVFGLTEKYIRSIHALVKSSGAEFMIFYIPMEGQLLRDEYSHHVRVYTGTQFGHAWNDRLKYFTQSQNIPFLDFLSIFQAHEKENLYLNQDGHLTLNGHQLVTHHLADFIRQKSVLAPENFLPIAQN